MKAFGLTLLVCIGTCLITKALLKPSIIEVKKTMGKQNCTPPSWTTTNSSHIKNRHIILDRTTVILHQSKKLEARSQTLINKPN